MRLFFILILFTVIGTLAQDLLLEPYGALVLNMPVAATSRLTMYWGLGVMAAMLLSGVLFIRLLGNTTVLRIGLVSTLLVFVGIILTGAMGLPDLFRSLVAVMGFGTGLAGAGLLSTIINFTTPARTGLLMGVWGMGMIYGRSLGALMAGIVVDIVTGLFGNAFAAYATVFALEAVLLTVALVLTARIHVEETAAAHETELTPVAAD